MLADADEEMASDARVVLDARLAARPPEAGGL
jgi:hypothetical protein